MGSRTHSKTALIPKGPEPLSYLVERATGSPRICFANPCFAAGLRPLRAALENAHAFPQLRTLPDSIPVAQRVNENGPSTPFDPQGSSIMAFSENRQAVYLRF